MSLSTWALSEVKERTVGGVWEKYHNCGGVSFTRPIHPSLVGLFSEHRLFVAMDWVLTADVDVSASLPGGSGRWAFGLQGDVTNVPPASFNTAGVSNIAAGVTCWRPADANSMSTGRTSLGIPWVRTLMRAYTRTDFPSETYHGGGGFRYVSLQSEQRTLVALRYVLEAWGVISLDLLAVSDPEGINHDVSQAEVIGLYNMSDWADIVAAMAPYGYTSTRILNNLPFDAAYQGVGRLDTAFYTFNHRYLACELSLIMGKVIW